MYLMRVRFANNVITFYEYEKPLADNLRIKDLLKEQLIERFDFFGLDYSFLNFNKAISSLFDKLDDEFLNNFDVTEFSEWRLLDILERFSYSEKTLFDLMADEQKEFLIDMKQLKSNFNAKKDRFIDLVSANLKGNCFFVTLTYNEQHKLYIDDLKKSHRNVTLFLKSVNWNFYKTDKSQLKYVWTWELQKKNDRNVIHYHLIFFDVPFKKLDLDFLRSTWGKGSVNVKRVNQATSGVSKYMSKYLLKDIDDLVNGKKSYSSSKNLLRPFNDYVVEFKDNKIITKSGDIIDLDGFQVERVDEYHSTYTGLTTKTIFNKGEKF